MLAAIEPRRQDPRRDDGPSLGPQGGVIAIASSGMTRGAALKQAEWSARQFPRHIVSDLFERHADPAGDQID
jgi:hypothetical protein